MIGEINKCGRAADVEDKRMAVLEIVYTIALGPLELLFDVVFAMAYRVTQNQGLALVFLSLTINILVLPLYRRADALQEEERLQTIRLKPGIEHIKKVFKGDERFMILQTYYRQNNYRPYYALKGSLPLLLEIPFFIAAYRYLSNLELLKGASFGPILDLGQPDNLVHVAGITIHLFPILMTGINIISGAIYTKGAPLKSKVQLYGMALIFLILLYDSPSGLVFYWTLNNLFSLGKNIFDEINKKKKGNSQEQKEDCNTIFGDDRRCQVIFYFCCIFMTIFVGGLIPSAIINSSPAEFVEMADFRSPMQYIYHTMLLSIGTFFVWFMIFYRLASRKIKSKFSFILVLTVISSIINYMFFGKEYGNLSPLLKYDVPISITWPQYVMNTIILFVGVGGIYLIWKKKKNVFKYICIIGCLAVVIMSLINVREIQAEANNLERLSKQKEDNIPEFTLDKSGKNVIVIVMDRAISGFVPYLFSEKPELKEKFSGFTYYPNALSYGLSTNVGTPPIYGGYEYTPFEMNKRESVSLREKHNEALKVMPVVFYDNGFQVTVCDPPYANYEYTSDLSIFDEYDGIHKYITQGAFDEDEKARIEKKDSTIKRNMFCYSIFRIAPLVIQKAVYNDGNYNHTDTLEADDNTSDEGEVFNYTPKDEYSSTGIRNDFISAYRALQNLPYMTKIDDSGKDNFLSLYNTTTHDVMLLQEPEFEPKNVVNNTSYEETHSVRKANEEKDMELITVTQMEHYECNMAAFIQLGNWFDYLKKEGVYDNTRIIITSDHGRYIGLEQIIMDTDGGYNEQNELEYEDVMCFNPLFMIKDFGGKEFREDKRFMTCADVPYEAFKGIIDEPINPFTGNAIDEKMKDNEEQYAMFTAWTLKENCGNTFIDPIRITLKNHYMFAPDNWEYGD